MRRKQPLRIVQMVLTVMVLIALLLTLPLIAGMENEQYERARQERTELRERLTELIEWIEQIRLKYGIDDQLPLREEMEEMRKERHAQETERKLAAAEATPQGQGPVGPAAVTAAAGITYSPFDWRAVVARVRAPGWQFTDSPEEYIAFAFKESADQGDPSGKSSHLWRTGQALRNGWQVYPMSDSFRQAAKDLYGATCIDDLLRGRGSPLAGYGIDFALEGRRASVDPYLLVALTAAESTFATDGYLCRENRNAWGMKGPNKTGIPTKGGWCWWPDWPSAIAGASYFVSVYWPGARTAYNCRGYCEGDPPEWIETVEYFRVILTNLGGEL